MCFGRETEQVNRKLFRFGRCRETEKVNVPFLFFLSFFLSFPSLPFPTLDYDNMRNLGKPERGLVVMGCALDVVRGLSQY